MNVETRYELIAPPPGHYPCKKKKYLQMLGLTFILKGLSAETFMNYVLKQM